jgi:hypothetical protein
MSKVFSINGVFDLFYFKMISSFFHQFHFISTRSAFQGYHVDISVFDSAIIKINRKETFKEDAELQPFVLQQNCLTLPNAV